MRKLSVLFVLLTALVACADPAGPTDIEKGSCYHTKAEWVYACRAGTTTPFYAGNNITTANANYDGDYPYNDNAKGTYRRRTTEVGSFAPNPWVYTICTGT